MTQLNGKVAIVTGGASGIGAAAAKRLASEGAKVVVTDINSEDIAVVAAEINELGGEAISVPLNVADEQSWVEAIERTQNEFGGLHIVFNNAGVGGDPLSVEDETLENWNKVIAINQTGVLLGTKLGGKLIKESGGGSIINTSSMFGLVGGFGSSAAYHASKGAVRTLTKNAALLWAKEGVRVNSIHPGFVETPILGEIDRSQLAQATPVGRLGTPEEIASLVAYLASDDAAFITGAEIVVDGGYTAA